MRARTEAAIAVGALTLLAFGVGLLARPAAVRASADPRSSTFLSGPAGSRGLLEGLRGLGIEVRRFRERPRALVTRLGDGSRQALVVLDPGYEFSPPERNALVLFNHLSDLVLAGAGAEYLMRCFGYRLRQRAYDSVAVPMPGGAPGERAPRVRALLEPTFEREEVDSTRSFDVGLSRCVVPPLTRVDTLLRSEQGGLVAVRLQRADLDRRVILFADAAPFRNRALRETAAGPFVLRLFQGRYQRVVFEEYHHGFGARGSLGGAALAWSRRSPWGWAVGQAALVGVLALLAGAVRFGVARPAIPRTRRSPLEHVRAVAVALSAARGHDEAIAALVRGLRRRLTPGGLRSRGDWRAWLAALERPGRSPAGQAALARLRALTRPRQPAKSVLAAANAVEDVWQDLKP